MSKVLGMIRYICNLACGCTLLNSVLAVYKTKNSVSFSVVTLCTRVGLKGATVQQQPQTGARDDDDATTQLSLKCLSDGRPTPSVEWLRNYVRSVS